MSFADVAAASLLLAGTSLFVIAAIGLHRFTDLYGRMHAATKPATLGLLLILGAAALRVDSSGDIAKLGLIALFQLATAPVAAHLLGRAAYRGGVSLDVTTGVDDLGGLEPEPDGADVDRQ